MNVIQLEELIKSVDKGKSTQDSLNKLIGTFACSKNPDVQSFLHVKAFESENRQFVRTYLVVDNGKIVGYFSLRVDNFEFDKEVSGRLKEIMTGNRKADSFTSVLIAQLGRSDEYKGIVSGKEILQRALDNCRVITQYVGGLRSAVVEYDDKPALHKFYIQENGFKVIRKNPDNNKIIAGIRFN